MSESADQVLAMDEAVADGVELSEAIDEASPPQERRTQDWPAALANEQAILESAYHDGPPGYLDDAHDAYHDAVSTTMRYIEGSCRFSEEDPLAMERSS